MAPGVRGVTALEPYVVLVLLANGQIRDVDMEPVLDLPVFEERSATDPSPRITMAILTGEHGRAA